jgi:hypothetical protein
VLLPAGQRVGPRVDDSAFSPVRQSLCVTSRLQGTEQGTLTAPNNLATWTGQAGNAAADRDQFAVLLPVLEQVTAARDCMSMRARLMMATPGHAALRYVAPWRSERAAEALAPSLRSAAAA